MALDGLGVASVVGTGGRIAGVADGGTANVFPEDRAVFARVRCAKDLGDCADILVGIDQLGAIGIEGADAGGQLAAVL